MRDVCGCHRCRDERRKIAEKVREACEGIARLYGATRTSHEIHFLDLDKLLEEE